MTKNFNEISLLIDFYGKLLTEKQLNYLSKYYFQDLSLSEIAKENNISRNAIHDSIKKSIIELKLFEEKLLFIKNFKKRILLYETICDTKLKDMLLSTEVYNQWKK